jgi:hypothetical protein
MAFSSTATSLLAKLMTPLGYLFKNATLKALETDMNNLRAICEQKTEIH